MGKIIKNVDFYRGYFKVIDIETNLGGKEDKNT